MVDKKNCMNCMRLMPVYDGDEIARRECMNNPGMRVNGRMVCEEWKSDDLGRSAAETAGHASPFVGTVNVTGIKREKTKIG